MISAFRSPPRRRPDGGYRRRSGQEVGADNVSDRGGLCGGIADGRFIVQPCDQVPVERAEFVHLANGIMADRDLGGTKAL
ncbi:hypothetical protein ACFYRC_17750 [Streptomyces sp. NPDC005279]|uniref:hypothetical protein n=1 Tax=Streptomyces sp. NPDC005279 TaxID=3364712 RepID=UPI003697BFD8